MSPDPAFRSLLLLALAAAAPAQAGFAIVTPESAGCPEGVDYGSVVGLSPTTPVDSIQLNWYTHDRANPASSRTRVIDESGEACSGAVDLAACRQALADLRHSQSLFYARGSARSYTESWLTWTRGDAAGIIDNGADLREWLGTIDTPGEARVLVMLDNYSPVCAYPASDGGYTVISTQSSDCPMTTTRFTHQVRPDGTITPLDSAVISSGGGCVGRLTAGAGFTAPAPGLGGRLARDARLEAIAALAFDRLAEELTAHGAPAFLIAGARQAATEERRHAEAVTALAGSRGAHVESPVLAEAPVRSLEAIAIENAQEGCVREVLGAAIGLLQARQAEDADIQAAMAQIAPEEVRHAEWSLALDVWLTGQLSAAAQARVATAKLAAWDALAEDVRAPAPEGLRRAMGLPTAAQAAAMLAALRPMRAAATV